jgi:hypothetical protein
VNPAFGNARVLEYAVLDESIGFRERIHPGSSGRWIDAHVSETEALKSRDAMLEGQRCSFCGKTPFEINQLVERDNVRICDSCIEEFHRIVREHQQSEARFSLRANCVSDNISPIK